MENITITLTNQNDGLRIQGTCENLIDRDVIIMLEKVLHQIKYYNLMEGLNKTNGGYFETLI